MRTERACSVAFLRPVTLPLAPNRTLEPDSKDSSLWRYELILVLLLEALLLRVLHLSVTCALLAKMDAMDFPPCPCEADKLPFE